MRVSKFAHHFDPQAGILQLMDDLGAAMNSDQHFYMLGGGNPSHIPEMQRLFRHRMQTILDNDNEFDRIIGNYDGPQGERQFIRALANLLRTEFGWDLGPENIAITNGSQSSFFILFNLFSGAFDDGSYKKILLPLTPEYIGYGDVGLHEPTFVSNRPLIEPLESHLFKYRIDFEQLKLSDDIGALCVSRPTNPTGNVLTDDEIQHLSDLAEQRDIPLIIDGAYGTPFPHIIFSDATPLWNRHTIVCLSLSKLGLPGVRTGIVIADESIIRSILGSTAVLNLAPGSIGPALALDLVQSGEIISVSKNIIQPYYQSKAEQAVEWLNQELKDYPYQVHKPEGAMFLWLWFQDMPITSEELYQRLKQRGVLVLAGHHFFPGLTDDWRHTHECLRVTYAQDAESVRQGIKLIGEEVRKAYS